MNKQKIKYLLLICVLFTSDFAFSSVSDKIDSLKNVLKTVSGKERSLLLFELSEIYQNTNSESALAYAQECLELSRRIKFKEGEAKALKSIGTANHLVGNYVASIEFRLEAIKLLDELNDQKEIANISINIGNSYFQQRQYDIAFEYYMKAKELSEEINEEKIYAKALNSIGHIYKIRNELQNALENNEIALKIWEKYEDEEGIIYCTVNKGMINHRLGDSKEALECYFKALELKRETNAEELESHYIYNNIAITYSQMGELQESNLYFFKSLKFVKMLNKTYSTSTIFINIARNYIELNNYPLARAYTDSAMEIAKILKSQSICTECYSNYSNIFRKTGDFKKALTFKEKYYHLKDSIYSERGRKRVEELEIKYDTEKKEKMIAIQNLLIKKKENQNIFLFIIASLIFIIVIIVVFQYRIKIRRNTELKESNQRLIESEKNLKQLSESKNKLFSVIVHDLRNPFGTLISVADFLEESYHEMDEEHKIQTVKTIKNSAQQTYELLENLLKQGNPNKSPSTKS